MATIPPSTSRFPANSVVIINIDDATLVMPMSRSEEVKDIVNLLTKEKEKYL